MPKTLLLADDSITIQKVVGITFAGEDFAVTAVDNGDDALAKARELKPDVILADVVMPRKNGYEVCEAVKADPGLRHIPVLLLAGTFEAFDEARARAARADGHIAKPFESGALINKVKELVEGRAAGPGAAAPRPGAPAPAARPAQGAPAAAPRPGAPMAPPGARPPGAGPAPGARPGAAPGPGFPPAGARPPGPGPMPIPPGGRPPQPQPPGPRPGMAPAMPPGAARPAAPPPGMPPGARPQPQPQGFVPGQPPPGARPAPGVPPPGAQRPPGPAAPPAGTPPGARAPGMMPSAPRAPAPAPAAARPVPAQAPSPPQPAPLTARKDPFGFGVGAPAAPRAPEPPRPADEAGLPEAATEEDWSDFDVAADAAAGAPPPEAPRRPGDLGLELDEPGAAPPEPIELPPESEEEAELAPMHAFVPPAETTGHRPSAAAAPAGSPGAAPVDGGDAALRAALASASREVIERVVWEVVPQLAETIIRENLDRLVKSRQG